MFRIIVKTKKGAENVIECVNETCTIGKGDENLVPLLGWSLGRLHATLHNRAAGVFIEDHGSRLGTEVNSKRIEGEHGPLQSSDQILVGDFTIRVERESPVTVSAPAADALPGVPAAAPVALNGH